jgi:hypothetical protein
VGDTISDGGMYLKHSQGSMELFVHNGSSYVSQGTYSVSNGARYRVDIRFNIHASTGSCFVYLNGELILSGTGLNTTAQITSVGAIGLMQTGPISNAVYSAIVASDESTRAIEFIEMSLTGDGTLTDWTGDYTDIDEAGYNDTDFINSETGGDQSTFTYDFTVPDGYVINSVILSGRMSNYGSLVSGIKGITYQGATAYDLSAFSDLPFLPGASQIISTINPATGLAWEETDITSGELGFETVA